MLRLILAMMLTVSMGFTFVGCGESTEPAEGGKAPDTGETMEEAQKKRDEAAIEGQKKLSEGKEKVPAGKRD